MDPLSVSASIVGLLTAARQVSVGIGTILSIRKNGSKEIQAVRTTVDTLRAVLLQLQLLLLSRSKINPERGSLIMVEEIVTTLTACVMNFSDLDSCVKNMASDARLGWIDSVRLAVRVSDMGAYLQSLEAHKASLSLILNILTWYASCTRLSLYSADVQI